jgi:hypothetical protein
VLERTTTRTLPILNRAADLAPTAQACCGVCRTCATTNIVGIALAGLTGAGLALKRVVRRRPAASA